MQSSKPLVSICIPTYNRASQLQKTIDAIIVQKEFLEGQVEVIISDNASDDDTASIGEAYSNKFKLIKYYRNQENISNRNFPLALSRATGVLRKLNNDTMVLAPGALYMLCYLAEKYQKSKPVIFLNNKNKGCGNETSMDFRNFVVKESYIVTWIAAFTIWGEDCEGIETDIDGCELRLWQVRKLYEEAYRKNEVIVCDKKIGEVIDVPKKNISYGLYQVFYLNYLNLLRPYKENGSLSEEDLEYLEKDLLYNFFTQWIIKWEMSTTNFQYSESENLKELVFKQYKNKAYWKRYLGYYQKKILKQKCKTMFTSLLGR